jgi:hypothetical protein
MTALNDPLPTLATVKCFAMCRERVADPGAGLGWQVLPLTGSGSAWFCPSCSDVRLGRTLLNKERNES